ncbi:hypothetical protein [Aquipseudomonas ullengensis]|uniref:Uncharacterized protein n=1 Tax=Aquipseudomonas ullengensis TaxID=2759166 RepID=A0A7W4LHX4_9GAMM|nr:hypothetical protein [Pseudomonas ullengensis]MBB2493429.1 hypothetical protein [Pseudomonas ullengensis]
MCDFSTRLRPWLCALPLILLQGSALADVAPAPVEPNVLDMERFLLLYRATGDERFMQRLNQHGEQFQHAIAGRKDPNTLHNLWLTYQESAQRVHQAYAVRELDLDSELDQALQVSGLFSAFLPQAETATAPSLADNLRQLARIKAALATQAATASGSLKASAISARIDRQLGALARSDAELYASIMPRWRYLQLTERNGKTLLYPFNAQIEFILARLQAAEPRGASERLQL